MNLFAFTICSNNYLPLAINLGKSLKQYNPDYLFKIAIVDTKNDSIDYEELPFDVAFVEELGLKNLHELILRYNITELNTALKPTFIKYFFRNEPDTGVIIYFDPDIQIFSRLSLLERSLKEFDISLTPHFTTPIDDDKKLSEEDILNTGLYNLGFIAMKRMQNTNDLLDWWESRLINKAYIDFEKGLFTDQIWINFAPLFFKNIHILKNKGYNVAYWNLHERIISKKEGSYLINNSEPLVFYHFSGFNPLTPNILSKYQNRYNFENRVDVLPLFQDYARKIMNLNYQKYINFSCEFVLRKNEYDLNISESRKARIPLVKRRIRSCILKFSKMFGIPLESNF